jgi:hypothetical protein
MTTPTTNTQTVKDVTRFFPLMTSLSTPVSGEPCANVAVVNQNRPRKDAPIISS